MKLSNYFESLYLTRLISRGVTSGTIAEYRAVIRSAPERPTLRKVTNWLASLDRSAATRNRYRRYLLAVLRDAVRHGKLRAAWLDQIPKATEQRRLPRAWTVDEFGRLLAACDTIREVYDGVPAPLWWRSFLLSLWYTGARVDSLAHAKRCDLDIQRGHLVLMSTKDNAELLYSLPPQCLDATLAMDAAGPLVWPWPFRDAKKTRLRRIRLMIAAAELPQLRQPFHSIRRSVASYVASSAGVAAACAALDHCRPSVTRRYYLDPRISRQSIALGELMPSPENNTISECPRHIIQLTDDTRRGG